MTGCPFRCGWSPSTDDMREVCVHLEVEHGADPERYEAAWESYVSLDPFTVEYVGTIDSPPFRFFSDDEEAS